MRNNLSKKTLLDPLAYVSGAYYFTLTPNARIVLKGLIKVCVETSGAKHRGYTNLHKLHADVFAGQVSVDTLYKYYRQFADDGLFFPRRPAASKCVKNSTKPCAKPSTCVTHKIVSTNLVKYEAQKAATAARVRRFRTLARIKNAVEDIRPKTPNVTLDITQEVTPTAVISKVVAEPEKSISLLVNKTITTNSHNHNNSSLNKLNIKGLGVNRLTSYNGYGYDNPNCKENIHIQNSIFTKKPNSKYYNTTNRKTPCPQKNKNKKMLEFKKAFPEQWLREDIEAIAIALETSGHCDNPGSMIRRFAIGYTVQDILHLDKKSAPCFIELFEAMAASAKHTDALADMRIFEDGFAPQELTIDSPSRLFAAIRDFSKNRFQYPNVYYLYNRIQNRKRPKTQRNAPKISKC